MNKQQVLERAIQKAIEGGFRPEDHDEKELTVRDIYYYFDDDHGDLAVNNLIWRHDFAKALWGDHCWRCIEADQDFDSHFHTEAWKYHLQQMVIAEDPIKYLEEHAC